MTVYHFRYKPTDPRLGRHVEHDSRSLDYLAPESDLSTLTSIRHERYVPVFDQGQVGSCTGNAAVGNVGTGAFFATLPGGTLTGDAVADEAMAVSVYSAAEVIDGDGPYVPGDPSTDNGSSGLSVAKVLKARGLISGYTHATSLNAVLTALAVQPVIVGTRWKTAMFDPEPDGRIRPVGSVEGGHEYVLDELDMVNSRVWMQNSWGPLWGIAGRAYITFSDLETLLAAAGDCTVFVPITVPAPQPTPPSPEPTPSPKPGPTPNDKVTFTRAAEKWLDLQHVRPANKSFAQAVKQYLATL